MKTLLVRKDGRAWRLTAHSRLQRKVLEMVSREDDPLGVLQDAVKNGCSSGIISGMIYYSDTIDFFLAHRDDITELVTRCLEGTRLGLSELFTEWNKEDPFAVGTSNRNLLAWFGFEESAWVLLDSKELVDEDEDEDD